MDKEQILIKHLKTMLKRTKQSHVTVEQMKETPEYKAVLNAMDEMETELVKNNAVLHDISKSVCPKCKDYYGIDINHKCFNCGTKLVRYSLRNNK